MDENSKQVNEGIENSYKEEEEAEGNLQD